MVSVGDLAIWDRALADGRVLSDAARQAMFTAHVPAQDDDGVIRTEGYGYGWFTGTASGGRRIYYHPGDQPGFCSERGQVGVQGLACPGVPGVLGVDGAAEQGPSAGRGWCGMIW